MGGIMVIYCPACGYKTNILESEFRGMDDCPLCSNILMKEETTFSALPAEKFNCQEIESDQTGLNEQIDKVILQSIINEIKESGEEREKTRCSSA